MSYEIIRHNDVPDKETGSADEILKLSKVEKIQGITVGQRMQFSENRLNGNQGLPVAEH